MNGDGYETKNIHLQNPLRAQLRATSPLLKQVLSGALKAAADQFTSKQNIVEKGKESKEISTTVIRKELKEMVYKNVIMQISECSSRGVHL